MAPLCSTLMAYSADVGMKSAKLPISSFMIGARSRRLEEAALHRIEADRS